MLYFCLCIIVIVAAFLSTIPSKVRRSQKASAHDDEPTMSGHASYRGRRADGKRQQNNDVRSRTMRNNDNSAVAMRMSNANDSNDEQDDDSASPSATATTTTTRRNVCLRFLLRGNNLDVALMSMSLIMEMAILVHSIIAWLSGGPDY